MGVNKVYLTQEGARVALYCQNNNEPIKFTKFGIGDGENLSPKTATAMTNEVVQVPVLSCNEVKDGQYRVLGEMSNNAITENLFFRELGLYCEDAKNKGTDVLYCYGNAKGVDFDYTEEIPAFDVSGAYSSRRFQVDIFLENDLNATFNIDSSAKADIKDVEELRLEVEGKANTSLDNITGILAKANGGTGNALGLASGLELAGTNGWTPETDTFSNWVEKGSCVWFIETEGQLNGQAGNYGLLVNYVNPDNDVHQLWLSQPAGGILHRGGNQSTGLGEWVLLIDSDNIEQYTGIPTQLKTAGLNGFTHDTDTPENWIKKGNCVWFFNEFGNMENQPSNYGLLVNLMEKPDGLDVHQIWLTQSGGEMYHRGGGAGGFEPWRKVIDDKNLTAETFTFVVDSNEKLAEWANNDRSKGQDYTSVLIKKGEWTSTAGVNLTNAGTKVVVGEAGNKLIFNDAKYSLFYDKLPTTDDFFMCNVFVEATFPTMKYDSGVIFRRVTNLKNCYAKVTNTGRIEAKAYEYCQNISHCTSITENTVGMFSQYGFSECENILYCRAYGEASGSSEGSFTYGFYRCNKINSCYGETNVIEGNNNSAIPFFNCERLTHCEVKMNSIDSKGFGFLDCKAVFQCKAKGRCIEGVFSNCYASNSITADYACADTPAGGFNDTTNPSA